MCRHVAVRGMYTAMQRFFGKAGQGRDFAHGSHPTAVVSLPPVTSPGSRPATGRNIDLHGTGAALVVTGTQELRAGWIPQCGLHLTDRVGRVQGTSSVQGWAGTVPLGL